MKDKEYWSSADEDSAEPSLGDAIEPAPAAKEEPAAPDVERKTPAEWARKLGLVRDRDARLPQSVSTVRWDHAAADKLHHWSWHAHHYQAEPLLLTQADYEAALDAAAHYPVKPAHAAATSPHKENA